MASRTRIVLRRPIRPKLYAILIANPSGRLYTHPIEWTAEHLDLLHWELLPPTLGSTCKAEGTRVQIEETRVLHGIEWLDLLAAVEVIGWLKAPRSRDEQMRQLIAQLCRAAIGLSV